MKKDATAQKSRNSVNLLLISLVPFFFFKKNRYIVKCSGVFQASPQYSSTSEGNAADAFTLSAALCALSGWLAVPKLIKQSRLGGCNQLSPNSKQTK